MDVNQTDQAVCLGAGEIFRTEAIAIPRHEQRCGKKFFGKTNFIFKSGIRDSTMISFRFLPVLGLQLLKFILTGMAG
ncbi:hypothetical protein [Candidatus Methylobacter favarea]|uniref:hypothetical protein n=1 Tax=Candidatus Methylobacter favarea TaxID=2707345 RepID=UPI00157D8E7E|nr:hypothetical protein [Candidatus Methylobacter favarea]